ncbi:MULTISPECIES: hypothetical protein [unclassified Acidovorax]|uniref:hypothetical protein n=1 Tax=unclassified Acidovorax TaxID=2684926 RepID=UPI001C44C7E6|nr:MULTISPECIES: hypothetical protein [unclassified Acidovorax]MBV7428261.1 hypothetical protein [Acidovorax sp. sif0732]MBV7449518.1 hypothetical protein [Acidovorax sp. sif0715]
MGYRDSDDSGFSRHGMGRDHDEGRYAERAHRGSMDRDDQRPGYAPELDDRYGQYGMVRNDYRGNAGLGLPPREGRDRFSSPDRFQGGGGYRNDGREMYHPPNSRFDSDYRDYQDQDRAGYARGGGHWGSDDELRGPSQGRQGHHDPDYQQWRQEQLRLLDEDYQSWRKERYEKFSDDFNTWRTSRNQQSPSKSQAGATGSSSTSNPGATSGKSKDAG